MLAEEVQEEERTAAYKPTGQIHASHRRELEARGVGTPVRAGTRGAAQVSRLLPN